MELELLLVLEKEVSVYGYWNLYGRGRHWSALTTTLSTTIATQERRLALLDRARVVGIPEKAPHDRGVLQALRHREPGHPEALAEGEGTSVNWPDNRHGTGVAGVVQQLAPDTGFVFIHLSPGKDGGTSMTHQLAYDWVVDNAQHYGIDVLVMSKILTSELK